MKTPLQSISRRGAALVLTMTAIVLMTTVLLAFLANVKTERRMSVYHSYSVKARDLANSALSMAQASIQNGSKTSQNECWTSQPGLIRVYDKSGKMSRWQALYSTLPESGTGTFVASDHAVPSNWADPSQSDNYVDLNTPVDNLYPIVSPSAFDSTIEGAALDTANMPGVNTLHPLPMPVQWLYLMKDGTLVDAATAKTSTQEVVGRFAYWTDDETAKVNINTASEGTYWDTPHTNAAFDKQYLAKYQPTKNEYQRYPGHPATTSLDPILKSVLPVPDGSTTTSNPVTSANYYQLSKYYKIAPGVNDMDAAGAPAGSQGGTHLTATTSTAFIAADNDRPYVSVDELLYDPQRSPNPGMTPATLEKVRFFLTAHSQAPETTLFGTPKIAAWPIAKDVDSTKTIPFDRTIAFCSTVGKKSGQNLYYFFQRNDPFSPTADYEKIPRNQELYAYLQRLTGPDSGGIPGFTVNTFKSKYDIGAENNRDQILTEILDYIRCLNLSDAQLASSKRFTPLYKTFGGSIGSGQVAPLRIESSATMGFGRMYTVGEIILIAVRTEEKGVIPYGGTIASTTDKMQLMLVLTGACVAEGHRVIQSALKFHVSGLSNLSVNGSAVNFPDQANYLAYHGEASNLNAGRAYGGFGDYRQFFDSVQSFHQTDASKIYPWISSPVTLTNTTSFTLTQSSGDILIEVYTEPTITSDACNTPPTLSGGQTVAKDRLVQTIKVKFEDATIPVPALIREGVVTSTASLVSVYSIPANRYTVKNAQGEMPVVYNIESGQISPTKRGGSVLISNFKNGSPIYRRGDTCRNLMARQGDVRMVAASFTVDEDKDKKKLFAPTSPDYTNFTIDTIINSKDADGGHVEPAPVGKYIVAGKLIDTTPTYGSEFAPCVPEGTASYSSVTGDFDNGTGYLPDGPWINKADEGSLLNIAGSGVPYYVNMENASGSDSAAYFSPNRMMPSPVMFGSLPSQLKSKIPWQTLLFRPQTGHIGETDPPDHLLLDLFWMPVVEPYPISTPMATSGKINMNYQIIPFTYITRATGLYAVLKQERMQAIKNTDILVYKGKSPSSTPATDRYSINVAETLKQFTQKFNANEAFRSASEICTLHLVPQIAGVSLASMSTFWRDYALTGDNSREKPYARIYPRLTTRSNTFQVHVWAQALQKAKGTGSFQVTGEYRGSYQVERYVDLNDPNLPDFATDPAKRLEDHYKTRVLSSTQFNP